MKYKKNRCSSLVKLLGLSFCIGIVCTLESCQKVEAVQEHNHTKVHVPRIDPTCIKEGRMEYWYCTQCGKTCSDRAMEHEISKEDTILAKIEHTIVEEERIDPTCEAPGKTSGKVCSYCKLVIEEQEELPALGHAYDYENPDWIWDGFDKAQMVVTCANHSDHKKTFMAEVSSTTIDPTCTEEGKTIYTACLSIEEKTYTNIKEEILLPIGHAFDLDNVTWEWENHSKAFVKIPCLHNEVHTLVCEADLASERIEPDCTTPGKMIYRASIVIEGKTLSDEKEESIAALHHRYDFDHIEWKWDGVTTATAWVLCLNDSTHKASFDAEITKETIKPTCEKDGKIIHTATIIYDGISYQTTKEEVLQSTGHLFDSSAVNWIWDGFTQAFAEVHCKNDVTHTKRYEAVITHTDLASTCLHEGKRIYTATTEIEGKSYVDQKEEILPIDPNHHEYDYESLSWQWIPTIDSYQVIVKVYCGCLEHASLSFEDITVSSTVVDSTLDQEGYIQYEAFLTLAGKSFSSTRTDILPQKQQIASEEDFLQAITSNSFSLILEEDLTISKPFAIEASYVSIDLNQHSLTLSDAGMSIKALKSYIKNGQWITGEKYTLGTYGISMKESSNLCLENMTIFGGIQASDSHLLIKNSDITATIESAVSLKNSKATLIGNQIYKCYENNATSYFFSLDADSSLTIDQDNDLYTTIDAKLSSLEIEEAKEIQKLTAIDYLTSDRLFKCISLASDVQTQDGLEELTLQGKKLYLSLENTCFNPASRIRITAAYATIVNGTIGQNTPIENQIIIDEGAEVLFKNLTVYGRIRVQKSTLDLTEVTIKSFE